jgi:molybdopterin converting factor small subunit
MDIKVRLFATLRIGRDKELSIEVEENTKIAQVISSLEISLDEVSILLLNGRDTTLDTVLTNGDIISIFPPVGGG